MWQLFKGLRSPDEAELLEKKFDQVLDAQADRLKVPPETLLADLRNALPSSNGRVEGSRPSAKRAGDRSR